MTHDTMMIVRDHDTCRCLELVDDWDATTILACVSSDPRSFQELGLAWQRYRVGEPLEDFPWHDYLETAGNPPESNWILIDLATLRLETNCEEAIPDEGGGFVRDEGEWSADNPVVWWNFPPLWQRVISSRNEPHLQKLVVPAESVDFRRVLFGRAMAEHVADRMSAIAAAGLLPDEYRCWADLPRGLERIDPRRAVANRWHELTVQVHASWLLTSRGDLNGETPRAFLHRGRDWVDREIQNRSQEWSRLRTAPRALDCGTYAYTHGPMGTEEVVVYFDLCREVIQAGWRMVTEMREKTKNADRRAEKMYEFALNWLENGEIEGCSSTPAAIIESSRRHMPQLDDGTHLDCECPLCRMMADEEGMFGPTFSSFSGDHLELDGEFAFSLCENDADWEERETAFERMNEEIDRRLSADDPEDAAMAGVWRGYVNSDKAGVSALSLGFRLTELIGDLKSHSETVKCVAALNDAFDALRKSPPALLDRQIAADAMKSELERVATEFPNLVSKSADLQSELDQWLRQLPPDAEISA